MTKIRKVMCSGEGCEHVVAHIKGERTIELKRLDQMVTVTGTNSAVMGTCPKHPEHQTAIIVNDGKLAEEDLRITEEEAKGEEDGDGAKD